MFPILLGNHNDLEKRVKTLEDSGGGAEIYEIGVTVDPDSGASTLSKTFKEIENAYKNGKICIIHSFVENYYNIYQYVIGLFFDTEETPPYAVLTFTNIYSCEHENDYPMS